MNRSTEQDTKVEFDPRNPLKLKKSDKIQQNDTEDWLTQDVDDRNRSRNRMQIKLDFNSDTSDEETEDKTKEIDDDDDDMFSEEKKPDAEIDSETSKNGPVKLLDMEAFEKEAELESENDRNNGLYDDKMDNNNIDDIDDLEEEVTAENTDINYFIDPDQAERTSRAKTQEPKLEAFNLKTDLDEGNFDTEGNFIRNAADDQAHQDEWLNGFNKRDIAAAKIAQEQRDIKERNSIKRQMSKSNLIAELCRILNIGESPLDALQQLNKKKSSRKTNKNRKNDLKNTSSDELEKEKEIQRKKMIENITELADELSSNGMLNIYEMTKEELMRIYHRETGETFVDLKRKRSMSSSNGIDEQKWEFQWIGTDEIHGPYTAEEIKAWIEQGYFDERVVLRRKGDEEFKALQDISFS